MVMKVLLLVLLSATVSLSFQVPPGAIAHSKKLVIGLQAQPQITSPFEKRDIAMDDDDEDDDELDPDIELPLTLENVERVLDELRPYLISDGGNVRVAAVDGPVVRLELEGACGTCPSSTMTMKMGLERRLKEVIPEISEVVQALPSAPELTVSAVDEVLDGVRPFLSVAGGQVDIVDLTGVNSVQPSLVRSLCLCGAHFFFDRY